MRAPQSDPNDLQQVGWCIVWPPELDPAIYEALRPLAELRREQAGPYFRETNTRPGESASTFLARHGMGPGPVDPERMPYYVLIVGDPTQVSFEFQQRLDLQYAVGRLHFDELEQYGRYAQSVVAAELSGAPQARHLAVVAPRHDADAHTAILSEMMSVLAGEALRDSDWRTTLRTGKEATKAALVEMLTPTGAPAILLTAAHSLIMPAGSPQHAERGAIVCGDWTGPGTPLTPQDVFAGGDVTAGMNIHGLVAMLWGSNTAGGLDADSAAGDAGEHRAFVTRLAQQLLGNGSGGALAVVGLADRMLGSSLGHSAPTRQALTLAIRGLARGHRVGHAMQSLDEAQAALSNEWSELVEQARSGAQVEPLGVGHLWSATMDLRRVVVLGDPAARLPAAGTGPSQ
jgi:hypothetical protein